MNKKPLAIVIAGPNGSGKTTFAKSTFPGQPFINADDIASEISPDNPETAAIRAGRELVIRVRNHIRDRSSFSVETTLAGKRYLKIIPEWKKAGYRVVLYYFFLPDPSFAIRRVRTRVESGGHSIDDDIITRRFWYGFQNLSIFMNIVDNCIIINNTKRNPTIMTRTEEF